MYKLFWKIFLFFWLALILFVGATLGLTSLYLEQTRGLNKDTNPRAHIRDYIHEARRVADFEGRPGLTRWLQELDNSEVIPVLLVDENGVDLLGRDVPVSLLNRFQRKQFRPQGLGRGLRNRPGTIQLNDGTEYRLMPNYQGVTLYRMLSRPRVIAIPLIIAALISGLVCFLLAQYLTGPIQKLGLATRKFAAGDLDVRVTPELGNRRDEIVDLALEFDNMAVRIKQLLESHMQLVGDVSHELRSPLARLHVALGLARQKASQNIDTELDRIELEAEKLNEMIDQVITISRLESGSKLVQFQPLNLNELLRDLVEKANFEVQQKSCSIQLDDPVDISFEGDGGLLNSALENVIRNAIKYTADNTAVEIALEYDDTEQIQITVRDHGPGAPENMLEKLFEPFVRMDSARDRNSGGYGLGLAIAERSIRLHQGKIFARNHAEGGLVITIILPLKHNKYQ